MEIKPIDTLEDLWKWEKREDIGKEYEEPLANFKAHSGPQILVCHDMKGGYLEEETKHGRQFEPETYPFTFLNWWQIDVFNYFSHHFVTIPPENYTRIAHKHGVLSLGTFITEWKTGETICGKILENEKSVEKTVDSLVAVSRYFGFDGWLINIENEIDPAKIDNLVRFCARLTEKSKESNGFSRVIWYDSVLHDGKLKWQNALNETNNRFYEACDAIYLNYNWKDSHLLRSAEFGILERIFVGIDVWARGCIGEFQCDRSFALAKLFRMSVALFAPGWIYEKFPEENQILLGIKFWEKLSPHVRTRPLTSASFTTNFCSGMEENWRFRLGSMAVQPQFLSRFCHPIAGKGLKLIGSNQKFTLFTFDSIRFSRLKMECESVEPVEFTWNRENHGKKKQGQNKATWTFEGPGCLESIEVRTTDLEETVLLLFSIEID